MSPFLGQSVKKKKKKGAWQHSQECADLRKRRKQIAVFISTEYTKGPTE